MSSNAIDQPALHEIPSISDCELQFIDSGAAAQQLFTSFDVDGDRPEFHAAAADRDEQKNLFLAGEIDYPRLNNCPSFSLDYDKRQRAHVAVERIASRLAVRRPVGLSLTPSDSVLTDLVDMRRAEHRAVETAAKIAKLTDGNDKSRLSAQLKLDLRAAYGMPSTERGRNVLAGRVLLADQVYQDKEHPIRHIAAEVLEKVNITSANYEAPRPMSPQAIAHYREIVRTECQTDLDHAFSNVGDKDVYSVEETVAIVQRFMDVRQYTDAGFSTILVPNRTSSLANMSEQAVLIGANRSAIQRSKSKIIDTLLHEVERHIGNMARARMLGMRLAEYALARSNVFEEAFAVTEVDCYNGLSKIHGEPYTTAIALAAGYDDGGERDYRSAHALHWRMSILKTFKPDKPLDGQIQSSQKSAATVAERVWRGMPTDQPGCIMPRDHAYDNYAVQRLLDTNGTLLSPEEYRRLGYGRIDPRVSNQVDYINQFIAA